MKKILSAILATAMCFSIGTAPVYAEESFSAIAKSAVDQLNSVSEANITDEGTLTLSLNATDAAKQLFQNIGLDISEINYMQGILGYDASNDALKINAEVLINDMHILEANIFDDKQAMYIGVPELSDVLMKTESVLSKMSGSANGTTAELFSNILSHISDGNTEISSYINPLFTDEYTVYHGTVSSDEIKELLIDVSDSLNKIPGFEMKDLEGFKYELNEANIPEDACIDLGIWKGDDGKLNGFSADANLGNGEKIAFYAMEDSTQMGKSLDVRLKGEGPTLSGVDISFSGSRTEEAVSSGTYTLFYGDNDLLTVNLADMEISENEAGSLPGLVKEYLVDDGRCDTSLPEASAKGVVSIVFNGDPESADPIVASIGSLKGVKINVDVDMYETSKNLIFDISKDDTTFISFGLCLEKESYIDDMDSTMFASAVDAENAGEYIKGVDTIVQNLMSAGISEETIQAFANMFAGTAQ